MTTSPFQPPDLLAADFAGPYDLPESLDASIPTTAQPGEPGIHWVARGLMAETCRQLLGRPITLEYIEHEHLLFISAVVSLASTVLSSNPLGHLLSADLILVTPSHRWALLVDSEMIAIGINVPSPRYLGTLIHVAWDARRRGLTDTCRGPAEPPSHLW